MARTSGADAGVTGTGPGAVAGSDSAGASGSELHEASARMLAKAKTDDRLLRRVFRDEGSAAGSAEDRERPRPRTAIKCVGKMDSTA